jgi:hypothetical protein
MMQLPEDDEEYLNEAGFDWELFPDGEKAGFLVIRGFDVSGGGLTPPDTDLMLRIPAQYNTAQLDMWYCDPPVKRSGAFPDRADHFEDYLGRRWQRFSRHLPDGQWRAGVDNLRTFFPHIRRELQGKG